jgi:hypothetical protein
MTVAVHERATAVPEAGLVLPRVHRLERVARSGWCWNLFIVRLGSGELLLHNPTWLGEGTFERIDALGRVRYLFTPNHFHNLHLRRFAVRYPAATVVAGEGALARLARLGIDGVQPIEAQPDLSPLRALSCAGAKNGETWLSIPSEDGPTWLVGDAFFNIERPVTGSMGWLLRALRVAPNLQVSRTFRFLVQPKPYREWALATLADEQPVRLLPAHGEPLAGAGLPAQLGALFERHF